MGGERKGGGGRRLAWRGRGPWCDTRPAWAARMELQSSQGGGGGGGAGFGLRHGTRERVWCELRKGEGHHGRFMRASQGEHGIEARSCELRTGWVGTSGHLGLRFSGLG
jgi:hypothetical protein